MGRAGLSEKGVLARAAATDEAKSWKRKKLQRERGGVPSCRRDQGEGSCDRRRRKGVATSRLASGQEWT